MNDTDKQQIVLEDIFQKSEDLVTRMIDREMVIVPMVSGVGDLNTDLYSLNSTGAAVWEKIDGHRTLKQITTELSKEFNAPSDQIQQEVTVLIKALLDKKILIKTSLK